MNTELNYICALAVSSTLLIAVELTLGIGYKFAENELKGKCTGLASRILLAGSAFALTLASAFIWGYLQ